MTRNKGMIIRLATITDGEYFGKKVNGTFELIEGIEFDEKGSFIIVVEDSKLYNMLPPSEKKHLIGDKEVEIYVDKNNIKQFFIQDGEIIG